MLVTILTKFDLLQDLCSLLPVAIIQYPPLELSIINFYLVFALSKSSMFVFRSMKTVLCCSKHSVVGQATSLEVFIVSLSE